MKKQFEASAETARLAEIFKEMAIGQKLSYGDLSKLAGFEVNSSNSTSARNIVERDYKIFIYSVRDFGLCRGSSSEMVDSGYTMFSSVKAKMRKCSNRMLVAISGNLDAKEHRVASEMYSRANIIADTSKITKVTSNRSNVEPGQKAPVIDIKQALKELSAN